MYYIIDLENKIYLHSIQSIEYGKCFGAFNVLRSSLRATPQAPTAWQQPTPMSDVATQTSCVPRHNCSNMLPSSLPWHAVVHVIAAWLRHASRLFAGHYHIQLQRPSSPSCNQALSSLKTLHSTGCPKRIWLEETFFERLERHDRVQSWITYFRILE